MVLINQQTYATVNDFGEINVTVVGESCTKSICF